MLVDDGHVEFVRAIVAKGPLIEGQCDFRINRFG